MDESAVFAAAGGTFEPECLRAHSGERLLSHWLHSIKLYDAPSPLAPWSVLEAEQEREWMAVPALL